MKIRYVIMIMVIISCVSAYMADRERSIQIQSTCEDENAVTTINGTRYVCLTVRDWNMAVEKIRSRGA